LETALRERGWVTGENLAIAYRYADGKFERLDALAAELVRLEPQVIVASPTAGAARNATRAHRELRSAGRKRDRGYGHHVR